MDNAQIEKKNTENIQRISRMARFFPGSICGPYHSSKYPSMHRDINTHTNSPKKIRF